MECILALTFFLHFSVLHSCIALLCGITLLSSLIAVQFVMVHKETTNKSPQILTVYNAFWTVET